MCLVMKGGWKVALALGLVLAFVAVRGGENQLSERNWEGLTGL